MACRADLQAVVYVWLNIPDGLIPWFVTWPGETQSAGYGHQQTVSTVAG